MAKDNGDKYYPNELILRKDFQGIFVVCWGEQNKGTL